MSESDIVYQTWSCVHRVTFVNKVPCWFNLVYLCSQVNNKTKYVSQSCTQTTQNNSNLTSYYAVCLPTGSLNVDFNYIYALNIFLLQLIKINDTMKRKPAAPQ